ncbi:MAG: glycosyltransferase [Opitutae bacterium]|nr:glycosyltransferase [Opitutae bacterium]
MKILHCIHSCNPEGGGPWEVVLQFSLEHIRQGHKVLTITTDDPDAHWCKEANIPIEPLGPARNSHGYTEAFDQWLKNNGKYFDCAIVHGLWQYPGRSALKILPRLNIPFFVYPHGMLDPWFKHTYPLKHLKKSIYWKLIENRLFKKARAVLFTCKEERRLAQHTFSPYNCHEAIAPLGIGTPPDDCNHQEQIFLSNFPHLKEGNFLLFLSRVHEKKGLDVLLQALAQYPKDLPQLAIAGPIESTTYLARLKQLETKIASKHNGWKITWTGMLTGSLKWGALRTAGAFILPSHQENFGIAVVEALAVGTPVLLSRKVNIWREIVDDGSGLAEEDTINGVIQLLSRWDELDTNAHKNMRENASRSFNKRFEISRAAANLIEICSPHLKT